MNNKGFTVVELIITFVIVMTISLGLFSTVDSYRERQQKEMYRKEVTSYRNEILKAIEDDITRYNFILYEKLDVTSDSDCSSSDGYDQGIQIKFQNIDGSALANGTKKLCFGNNVQSSGKAGIMYDGVKYIAPTKFIKFEQDIIDSVTKNVDSKIPMITFSGTMDDGNNINTKEVFSKDSMHSITATNSASIDIYTVIKDIYSFNIRIKHEEIKSEFNLNVTFTKSTSKTQVGSTISGVSVTGSTITVPTTSITDAKQLDYIKQAFANNGFDVGTDVMISAS